MTPLTLILPFFHNRGMLAEQFAIWSSYPEDLRAQLHVIVVDDCSAKGHRASPKDVRDVGLASFRLYRITKKVRWNWLACRNLAVDQATTDWVLMTDMDHALPVETLTTLLTAPREERNVYRLSRADAPRPWPYALDECAPYKAHPNTWLMTRAMFDRIGGYDERLSGCYGTDGEFRDRVSANANAVVTLPDVLIRYPREVIEDASTHPSVFTRKNDPVNDDDLRRRRLEREQTPNWRPLRLSFPWERLL
jgi:hypothetical protein